MGVVGVVGGGQGGWGRGVVLKIVRNVLMIFFLPFFLFSSPELELKMASLVILYAVVVI